MTLDKKIFMLLHDGTADQFCVMSHANCGNCLHWKKFSCMQNEKGRILCVCVCVTWACEYMHMNAYEAFYQYVSRALPACPGILWWSGHSERSHPFVGCPSVEKALPDLSAPVSCRTPQKSITILLAWLKAFPYWTSEKIPIDFH